MLFAIIGSTSHFCKSRYSVIHHCHIVFDQSLSHKLSASKSRLEGVSFDPPPGTQHQVWVAGSQYYETVWAFLVELRQVASFSSLTLGQA
jgi:hypothetical protein